MLAAAYVKPASRKPRKFNGRCCGHGAVLSGDGLYLWIGFKGQGHYPETLLMLGEKTKGFELLENITA